MYDESSFGFDGASLGGVWDCSTPVFPAPLHELHHGAALPWSLWSRCYSIKNVELVEYPLRYSRKNVEYTSRKNVELASSSTFFL
jgi:hypothetical protein